MITEVDGRRARREQNRMAVLHALVELHREGSYDPGTARIAERAGLSPRSLFRYFDDVDDLNRAAIEHQLELAKPLLAIAAEPADPTGHKAKRLADGRVRLFEAIAPAARAARVCAPRHPMIAAQIDQARAFYRSQLRKLFAPELAAMREEQAGTALAAADVVCSFESYDLLRRDHRLSRRNVARTMHQALCDLLGVEPGGRA
jgi:AcrR family transcriptional regulator